MCQRPNEVAQAAGIERSTAIAQVDAEEARFAVEQRTVSTPDRYRQHHEQPV